MPSSLRVPPGRGPVDCLTESGTAHRQWPFHAPPPPRTTTHPSLSHRQELNDSEKWERSPSQVLTCRASLATVGLPHTSGVLRDIAQTVPDRRRHGRHRTHLPGLGQHPQPGRQGGPRHLRTRPAQQVVARHRARLRHRPRAGHRPLGTAQARRRGLPPRLTVRPADPAARRLRHPAGRGGFGAKGPDASSDVRRPRLLRTRQHARLLPQPRPLARRGRPSRPPRTRTTGRPGRSANSPSTPTSCTRTSATSTW